MSDIRSDIRFVVGVLCLALLPVAPARAAEQPSLYNLLQQARQRDHDYAAARSAYEAELESRNIGRAGLLPNVSLAVDVSRSSLDRRDQGGARDNSYSFSGNTASLQIAQPLFDLERWAAYLEGGRRADLAEVAFADAGQELILRVAQAWFGFLFAQDTVDLAVAQVNALAAHHTEIENLFRAGAATVTDVEETAARQRLAESQELIARNTLNLKRRELGKIVGEIPAASASRIVQVEPVPPQPNDLQHWLERARAGNLNMLGQRLAHEVAGFQSDKARAGYFPRVALTASQQRSREPNYFTATEDSTRMGIQLNMNLFEGGRASAAIRQADALKEKVAQGLETAILDAEIKASDAFLGMQNGIAQIGALNQAVNSSEIALKGMQAGQKVGFRTNSDVLNAQQQLFAARRDLQQARYDYLLSRLRLKAAVGALKDQEVAEVDGFIVTKQADVAFNLDFGYIRPILRAEDAVPSLKIGEILKVGD